MATIVLSNLNNKVRALRERRECASAPCGGFAPERGCSSRNYMRTSPLSDFAKMNMVTTSKIKHYWFSSPQSLIPNP